MADTKILLEDGEGTSFMAIPLDERNRKQG